MFISPAYAQAAGGTPGGDIISMILPLVMIMQRVKMIMPPLREMIMGMWNTPPRSACSTPK